MNYIFTTKDIDETCKILKDSNRLVKSEPMGYFWFDGKKPCLDQLKQDILALQSSYNIPINIIVGRDDQVWSALPVCWAGVHAVGYMPKFEDAVLQGISSVKKEDQYMNGDEKALTKEIRKMFKMMNFRDFYVWEFQLDKEGIHLVDHRKSLWAENETFLEYSYFELTVKGKTARIGLFGCCDKMDIHEWKTTGASEELLKLDPDLNIEFIDKLNCDLVHEFLEKSSKPGFKLQDFCKEYHEEFHFSEIKRMPIDNMYSCNARFEELGTAVL